MSVNPYNYIWFMEVADPEYWDPIELATAPFISDSAVIP
jgi:hypothetical protein